MPGGWPTPSPVFLVLRDAAGASIFAEKRGVGFLHFESKKWVYEIVRCIVRPLQKAWATRAPGKSRGCAF